MSGSGVRVLSLVLALRDRMCIVLLCTEVYLQFEICNYALYTYIYTHTCSCYLFFLSVRGLGRWGWGWGREAGLAERNPHLGKNINNNYPDTIATSEEGPFSLGFDGFFSALFCYTRLGTDNPRCP